MLNSLLPKQAWAWLAVEIWVLPLPLLSYHYSPFPIRLFITPLSITLRLLTSHPSFPRYLSSRIFNSSSSSQDWSPIFKEKTFTNQHQVRTIHNRLAALLTMIKVIMMCGCGLGFGLLKKVQAKDLADDESVPPKGSQVSSMNRPAAAKTQYHQQLAELLHPLSRSSLPEFLRERVLEPTPKVTSAVAEKIV